jgi:hypothetical protein
MKRTHKVRFLLRDGVLVMFNCVQPVESIRINASSQVFLVLQQTTGPTAHSDQAILSLNAGTISWWAMPLWVCRTCLHVAYYRSCGYMAGGGVPPPHHTHTQTRKQAVGPATCRLHTAAFCSQSISCLLKLPATGDMGGLLPPGPPSALPPALSARGEARALLVVGVL